jgi:hypothetical protein
VGGVIANVIAVRKTVVNPEFSQGGHFKARCAAAAAETRQRRREQHNTQHNTHHLCRGPLVKATLPVYKRFRVVFFARFLGIYVSFFVLIFSKLCRHFYTAGDSLQKKGFLSLHQLLHTHPLPGAWRQQDGR